MSNYSAHLEPFRQLAREIKQQRSTAAVSILDLPQSEINSLPCLDASIDLASKSQMQEVQDNVELGAIEFSYSLEQSSRKHEDDPEILAAPQPEIVKDLDQEAAVRQRREGLKSAVSHDAFPMVAFLMGLIALVWVFWKLAEVIGQGIYAAFITLYRVLKGKFFPETSNYPVVAWAEWVENPVGRTHLQKI